MQELGKKIENGTNMWKKYIAGKCRKRLQQDVAIYICDYKYIYM